MSNLYICECGKVFDNPQKYNGHKSHCREHYLAIYGTDEKYAKNKQLTLDKTKKMQKVAKNNAKERNKNKLDAWIAEQHKCEKCGKIMTEKYGSGRFCSRFCANSRDHSKETLEKISKSTSNALKYAWQTNPEAWLNSKKSIIRRKSDKERKYCTLCNKELYKRNTTGLCQTCLRTTDYGKELWSELGKKSYEKMKLEGKHHPWQSRNITSYAEDFWKKVLDNNLIQYQRELPVKHDNSNYFIDFYIEAGNTKIDLEIDGKQHLYEDRQKSDKIRDEYLTSLGYLVYRVAWNEISSEDGKKQMEEKINNFLVFYNTLLLHSIV